MHLIIFTSFFAICKDQKKKDGSSLEPDRMPSFQKTPVSLASEYLLDWLNFFTIAHFDFTFNKKRLANGYCFVSQLNDPFLTPVKWLSNVKSLVLHLLSVPQTGGNIINISFFPSIYSPRASRLDHKSMGKNSVRSLQYGPKGRWKELEVNRGYSSHTWLNVAIAGAGRRPLFLLSSGIVSPTLYGCSLLEILSIFNTWIYYCFLEWAINVLRHWSPNVVVTDNNSHPSPLLLVNSKRRLEQQHIMESLTLRDSIASRGVEEVIKSFNFPFWSQ